MASRLELVIRGDRALVRIVRPEGAALNTLGRDTLRDFAGIVERLAAHGGLAGAVIAADEGEAFLAGADLDELGALTTPERAGGLAAQGQQLLERWAALPFPTVAAVHGGALGGGLEVALACDWRVASDHPSTSLGLPEVRLGLLPALGGTYRLPRRVGLTDGVEMLLTGRRLGARPALAAGLVDEVVPAPVLLRAAFARLGEGKRGEATPGVGERVLAGTGVGRSLFFQKARETAREKSGGHYPAPLAILDVVETGYRDGRDAALAAEARRFSELALSPVARRLTGLFLATRRLGAGEAAEGLGLGVVGAGFMGSGIAAAAARAGHRVRLVDLDREALGRALAFCSERFAGLARRGRISREEARRALHRVSPSPRAGALGHADLVVEAVVESLEVKRRVFAELEARAGEETVLASNTSTIPIATLADGLERPERVVGLHFFSPVHRMPLVEVIRHPGSAAEAVGRSLALVRSLGKTPIVVRDGPGFYTSRILSPYLAQAARMLLEGATVEEVDAAGRRAGFPVGPLELLDEVGIDVAAHAARTMAEAFPERMPVPEELGRLTEEGRKGRKSGVGFYDYSGRRKRPDPEVHDLLGAVERPGAASPVELTDRLVWSMAAEAVRCLEEEIVETPSDGDVGAVLGLGFPPFRGGPFRFLDGTGLDRAVERLAELADRHGPAFAPPRRLEEMVAAEEAFHQEP